MLDADGKMSWSERFALVTTYMHAVASLFWLLLWTVGPPDNNWLAHLAIFSICVFLRYMCTLGNYIEQRFGTPAQRLLVKTKHTVFISVYGVVTTIMPVVYFIDIGVYMSEERTGVDPPVPWWIIQTMDVLWVLCLASTTSFCIPEPPLEIRCKVLQFDEEYDVPENAALIGGLPSTDRNDEGGKRQEEVHVQ